VAGNQYGRCSDGHVFPIGVGDHVLSLHLGTRRLMRCPVDKRWRMVEMVWEQDLTDAEIQQAASDRS
jgi:hypothetical protein